MQCQSRVKKDLIGLRPSIGQTLAVATILRVLARNKNKQADQRKKAQQKKAERECPRALLDQAEHERWKEATKPTSRADQASHAADRCGEVFWNQFKNGAIAESN